MSILKRWKGVTVLLVVSLLVITPSLVLAADSLKFDPKKFETKMIKAGDLSVTVRAYEGIVYVKNPVDAKHQSINIYVPSGISDKDSTTPIFFPNGVGGYNPALPQTPGVKMDTHGPPPHKPMVPETPNTVVVALSKGYIVASAGARGKTQDYGRAPAGLIDLKAAVRYLRYNDAVMPGDAKKIVSNGTSAGGAMSSLLGATGNNKEYAMYLKKVGAADAPDDIFAASCYCPITNLDNSDTAYEWLFHVDPVWHWFLGPKPLTEDQLKLSKKLRALFPAYVNSLGLRTKKGASLGLDKNGEGNFKDYVMSFVIESAQKALDSGKDFSGSKFGWMTIKNGKVVDIDMAGYAKHVTRMKPVPAFDAVNLSPPPDHPDAPGGTWENILFGTGKDVKSKHFTKFSTENSARKGPMADPKIIKMMSPMGYIGVKGSTITKNWRIRHGAADRDTAIAIPIILTTKLRNAGYKVDFGMPWGQGHGGDYDLDELFAWIKGVTGK